MFGSQCHRNVEFCVALARFSLKRAAMKAETLWFIATVRNNTVMDPRGIQCNYVSKF